MITRQKRLRSTHGQRGRRHSCFICSVLILTAISLSFGYGVGVGAYQWPPFSALSSAKDIISDNKLGRALHRYRGEQELLRFAFTDPLIKGEQVHAPITSLAGIVQANKSMLLPVERFFDAYSDLEIVSDNRFALDQGTTQLLRVTYTLAGNVYDAYTYTLNASEASESAVLIIPGSGVNRSSVMYENYASGILKGMDRLHKFILIKPNEDHLAFHNGKSKLNQDFFISWLLDQGGSYSAHYIANSLAVTKYLKIHYKKVIIVGRSQGGSAALLNSLQSQPDAAIIASGFSVLDARVRWANHNQIIIPGLQQRLSVGEVRSRIQELSTAFLFTYGKKERGTYKIEAEEGHTCKYLSGLENVECRTHQSGHVFPVQLIQEFLSTL